MTKLTPTKLRENLYKVLDEALETGQSVAIERKGQILTLVPPKKKSKLEMLKKRKGLRAKPDDIIYMDWMKYWKPFL